MRRVWGFLSDPTLNLIAIALFLIVLAIGSSGSPPPSDHSSLAFCVKCRSNHYVDPSGRCPTRAWIAQTRP